jgi:hypothetical protein
MISESLSLSFGLRGVGLPVSMKSRGSALDVTEHPRADLIGKRGLPEEKFV